MVTVLVQGGDKKCTHSGNYLKEGFVDEVVCSVTWQTDHACQFYHYNFSLQFAWAPARVAIAGSYFFDSNKYPLEF